MIAPEIELIDLESHPMTRTLLTAVAAVISATALLSSAAEACLSCEYVPEVVRNHTTDRPAVSSYDSHRVRAYASQEDRGSRSSRKRTARAEEPSKPVKAAKSEKIEKTEKVKVAKVTKPAKVAPVKIAKAEPATAKVETKRAEAENSSITVAAVDAAKFETSSTQKVDATKPTDCKKFFASVGMTLTVPCE